MHNESLKVVIYPQMELVDVTATVAVEVLILHVVTDRFQKHAVMD